MPESTEPDHTREEADDGLYIKPEDMPRREISLLDAFNPYHPDGIWSLKNAGVGQGYVVAKEHYPGAVLWTDDEIETYGRKSLLEWFRTIGYSTFVDKFNLDYDHEEQGRIFAAGFAWGYARSVDNLDQAHAGINDDMIVARNAARRRGEIDATSQGGTSTRIVRSESSGDGRIYEVELSDPALTQPARFEVEIADSTKDESA